VGSSVHKAGSRTLRAGRVSGMPRNGDLMRASCPVLEHVRRDGARRRGRAGLVYT